MTKIKLLRTAVAASLTCSAMSVSAALPANAVLQMGPQTGFCAYGLGTYPDACVAGAIPDGNYFAMDNDGSGVWEDAERVGIEPGTDGGIVLGGTQGFGTSTGTGATLVITAPGDIDAGWGFFSNAGWHTQAGTLSIATDDDAGNVTLDMTGWNVHWNDGDIDMGQGANAIISCGADCGVGDSFTLDYNAVVPSGGFAGVAYQFHITGTIGLPSAPVIFTPQTDVLINTQIESNAVNVAVIPPNGIADISISAGSEYKINTGTYTSAPGTITDGDTVQVRHASAATFSTDTVTTLTIGSVDSTFTSTTEAQDLNSDVLNFPSQAGVPVNTDVTSDAVAVTGINDTAPISIDVGAYSIDGGAFVSVAGSVDPDQTVTIQHTSAPTLNTDVVSTITIGTTDSTFTSSTSAADTTPDPFSFPNDPLPNVPLSTVVTSGATAPISGINAAATISVINGEYSIEGAPYTSAAGTINAGQTVEVRHTSASTVLTPNTTTLDIGGVTADFTSTTEAADTMPDPFFFTTQTDVARGSLVTSDDATVTGINVSVDISVANGEYAIDGGSFTTIPGTIDSGQTVTVRHTATTAALSDTVTTLTIGGVDGTFTSTTAANVAPVAVNDSATIDVTSVSNVTIDVTANDTDEDGIIEKTTVLVVTTNDGSTIPGPNPGEIIYTPDASFVGTDTFTYTVEDDDGAVSNEATVSVIVSDPGAGVLPVDATLTIVPATITGETVNITPADGEGSWFNMEVNPGVLTHVSIQGFNHLQLGTTQPGSEAVPNIDNPWPFFGNQGVHQTTSDATVLSDDGQGNVTLDLSGWDVSWNNIASIPMSGGAHTAGFVDGVGIITCANDCAVGDSYKLEYSATVPPGDPSGFGNVKYFVHLEGIVSEGVPSLGGGDENAPYDVTETVASDENGTELPVLPGTTADSVGNTTGINLTPADIGLKDPKLNESDGQQCIGGCVDFVVDGVTTGYVDVVFKLNDVMLAGAIYRKLMNGVWDDFDESQGDQIGSATSTDGACQGPEGVFDGGLRAGNDCLFMRIFDNGPNDADSATGSIADPSGALLAGSPNTPAGFSEGCSISSNKVDLTERADWLVVFGFMTWLGLLVYRRKKATN